MSSTTAIANARNRQDDEMPIPSRSIRLGHCRKLLPLLMIILIATMWFAHTYLHCVPLMQLHKLPKHRVRSDVERGMLHFFLLLISVTLLMASYVRAIMVLPGYVPNTREWAYTESDDYKVLAVDFLLETKEAGGNRRCKKCATPKYKPDRAHHCRVCQTCVLRMDHHCPWINNCVGWNNYRNFCLFMLYLFIGCIFVVVNFFPEFVLSWTRRSGHSHFERSERRNIHLAFVIAGSVIISLSILGGFHAFLVLTNQTTIEFQQNWISRKMARQSGNMFRNPYDLGRTRNFQQVFGQIRFWTFKWMLPIEPAKLGDGATWPSLFHQHI
eukprot:GEMP01009118.1.p1 GENE.GEMP01009118.1~~GEMP01009118.1.p1  ORF type:complete len:327 (+),score=30.98 GEMP01009118.1:113-1093(+)